MYYKEQHCTYYKKNYTIKKDSFRLKIKQKHFDTFDRATIQLFLSSGEEAANKYSLLFLQVLSSNASGYLKQDKVNPIYNISDSTD